MHGGGHLRFEGLGGGEGATDYAGATPMARGSEGIPLHKILGAQFLYQNLLLL